MRSARSKVSARTILFDANHNGAGCATRHLLIAISTQAADAADLFSQMARMMPRNLGTRGIVSHVYAAPKKPGLPGQKGWRAANPALGIFRQPGRPGPNRPNRLPDAECGNTFRNLCLNQRGFNGQSISSQWMSGSPAAALSWNMAVRRYGVDLICRVVLT